MCICACVKRPKKKCVAKKNKCEVGNWKDVTIDPASLKATMPNSHCEYNFLITQQLLCIHVVKMCLIADPLCFVHVCVCVCNVYVCVCACVSSRRMIQLFI